MTPPRKPARWSVLGVLRPVVFGVSVIAVLALVLWLQRGGPTLPSVLWVRSSEPTLAYTAASWIYVSPDGERLSAAFEGFWWDRAKSGRLQLVLIGPKVGWDRVVSRLDVSPSPPGTSNELAEKMRKQATYLYHSQEGYEPGASEWVRLTRTDDFSEVPFRR